MWVPDAATDLWALRDHVDRSATVLVPGYPTHELERESIRVGGHRVRDRPHLQLPGWRSLVATSAIAIASSTSWRTPPSSG